MAAEKIEIKKDCFAYDGTKTEEYACSALNNLYCKNEKCNFYKSKHKQSTEHVELKEQSDSST